MRLYCHLDNETDKADILSGGFGSAAINPATGEVFEVPVVLTTDGEPRFVIFYPPAEGRKVSCPDPIAFDLPDAMLAGREVDTTDTPLRGRHFALPARLLNRLLMERN